MIEVEKIWLTDDAVWIRTKDGSEVCEMYRDYPRLATADKKLIELFEADEYGIHWPELDEDLSYEGFFKSKPVNRLYEIFKNHPELNASAVARRVGISQSLFAQYLSGVKNPSEARLEDIISAIRSIGKSLQEI